MVASGNSASSKSGALQVKRVVLYYRLVSRTSGVCYTRIVLSMAGKRGVVPKSAFVKGDPRINRNGRPKSFDQLRRLTQKLMLQEITDADGVITTVVEQKLKQWIASLEPRLQIHVMDIAYGKVPETQIVKGEVANVAMTLKEWEDRKLGNTKSIEEMEEDFADEEPGDEEAAYGRGDYAADEEDD